MTESLVLPLFVFGTLRRGECNHDAYLAGHYLRVTPARLPGYGVVGELMIAPVPSSVVPGELFELDPATYQRVLAHCDELESIVPGTRSGPEYVREIVTVETDQGPVVAWVYVQPPAQAQASA